MLYFNRNGVWFTIPIAKGAVYDRELLEKQIHSASLGLQNLKDRSPGLDQMRFEKPGEYVIKSVFGRDDILIIPPIVKKGQEEKEERELIARYIPAIEVYDIDAVFKGILICHSGTFEPPYEFIGVADTTNIDPFLWGQWQIYFSTIPFVEPRSSKLISYEQSDNNTKIKSVEDIPSTNDTLAYWDFGDTETAEDGQYTDGPSYDYWHLIHISGDIGYWLCCTWVRAESWNYYYDYSSVTEGQLKLINYAPWYFISDAIEGGSITYDYSRRFDGTFTNDISPSECFAPPDWGLIEEGCAAAEAAARAAPSRGPTHDGITPVPIHYAPDSDSQFGSGSINDEQIGFVDWLGEQSTAYQADKFGGTVGATTTGGDVQYNSRTDGGYAVDEATRVISGSAVCMATYGVDSTTYADTRIWKEGALVDGTFYDYRQGAGYYGYWSDVPDAIGFDIDGYVHPRYWGSLAVGSPIFMSSGFRYDYSTWAYFHVAVGGVLTGTEFSFSHENVNGIFHTIPDFPDYYGKGYFRLVRVTEETTKKTVIDL